MASRWRDAIYRCRVIVLGANSRQLSGPWNPACANAWRFCMGRCVVPVPSYLWLERLAIAFRARRGIGVQGKKLY